MRLFAHVSLLFLRDFIFVFVVYCIVYNVIFNIRGSHERFS